MKVQKYSGLPKKIYERNELAYAEDKIRQLKQKLSKTNFALFEEQIKNLNFENIRLRAENDLYKDLMKLASKALGDISVQNASENYFEELSFVDRSLLISIIDFDIWRARYAEKEIAQKLHEFYEEKN